MNGSDLRPQRELPLHGGIALDESGESMAEVVIRKISGSFVSCIVYDALPSRAEWRLGFRVLRGGRVELQLVVEDASEHPGRTLLRGRIGSACSPDGRDVLDRFVRRWFPGFGVSESQYLHNDGVVFFAFSPQAANRARKSGPRVRQPVVRPIRRPLIPVDASPVPLPRAQLPRKHPRRPSALPGMLWTGQQGVETTLADASARGLGCEYPRRARRRRGPCASTSISTLSRARTPSFGSSERWSGRSRASAGFGFWPCAMGPAGTTGATSPPGNLPRSCPRLRGC